MFLREKGLHSLLIKGNNPFRIKEEGNDPMNEKKEQALFEYDAKLSISEAIPMGLQHVVAAVVGIVTPGIMIAKVCQLSPSDTTILIQTSLIFQQLQR